MLKKHSFSLIILAVFTIISVLIFRKYFFEGYVPLPSNLLVSFYSPWKYEEWEGYPNGPANKPIGFDVLKLFYPYRVYTTERLQTGELPLWNPYVFSGNIHLATYQSAVFYPLNFIYFVLPTIDAWSLLVVVQPILAGFFTYLFLREIKFEVRSSFFGSVVFALSGWLIAWMEESLVIEHSALWLPLILYGVQRISRNKPTSGFLFMLVGLTLSILAGFLQMTIYVGIFSFGFVLFSFFTKEKKDKRLIVYFLLACIGSVLISAIHLLPAFSAYFYSPRGVVSAPFVFDMYLMKPWHLITLITPDFWGNPGTYSYFSGVGFYHEKVIFIGIPATILAIYALFHKKEVSNYLRYFKWTTIITFILGFVPFGWLLYYVQLPIISAMVPSRIFFLSTFSLSILAGFGMDIVLKKEWDSILLRKIFICITVVLGCLWIFVFIMRFVPYVSEYDPKGFYGNIAFRNLVIPTIIFLCCALSFYMVSKWRIKATFFYVLIVLLTIASSFFFANKFLYFSERMFVFPDVPVLSKVKELALYNRVWGYGNGYVEKNMLSHYGIYSPEGYDALYSQYYGELLYIQESKGMYTNQISRTDAQIRQASEGEKLYDNPFRSRLLSLLGVRYILESKEGDGKDLLTTEERFPLELFILSWEDENFRIWEYKQALPRVFLTRDYIVEKNPEVAVKKLFDPTFNIAQTLVLEEKPVLSDCDSPGEQNATIVEYLPEKVKIKTNSPCESLLFFSDTYYPGWIGKVDSTTVPILRTNHALRSVVVPEGEHLVEFIYAPKEVQWGMYISIVSLIALFPILLLTRHG